MLGNDQILKIFERLEFANPSPQTELVATNAYTFVIAVLLSAQTTDKAVNIVTSRLFKDADSPEAMLELGITQLKEHIKTLGLYNRKAENIIALSKIIIEEHGSTIPNTKDELEKLPGIGGKSANVILNTLFGNKVIAVDTHVLRVANRLGLTSTTNPIHVENILMVIIPEHFIDRASHWLVLHGRYTCTAKHPRCARCILNDICKYNKYS